MPAGFGTYIVALSFRVVNVARKRSSIIVTTTKILIFENCLQGRTRRNHPGHRKDPRRQTRRRVRTTSFVCSSKGSSNSGSNPAARSSPGSRSIALRHLATSQRPPYVCRAFLVRITAIRMPSSDGPPEGVARLVCQPLFDRLQQVSNLLVSVHAIQFLQSRPGGLPRHVTQLGKSPFHLVNCFVNQLDRFPITTTLERFLYLS